MKYLKAFEKFCEEHYPAAGAIAFVCLCIQVAELVVSQCILISFIASIIYIPMWIVWGIGRHIPQKAFACFKERRKRQ